MAKIVGGIAQNTPEWLEYRKNGLGASDAPVIAGVSPWMTPLQLWQEKTGTAPEREPNEWMARGIAMEPIARAAYEAETGNVVEPALAVHPQHDWLRASLDGLSFDGDLVIEIKCPGRSKHNEAKEGHIPDVYWPQLQHQLMLAGATHLHYWSFDGEEGVLIPVEPDSQYQEWLLAKEREFWQHVIDKTPPEAMRYEGEIEIATPEALDLAARYARTAAEVEQTCRIRDRLKNELLALCTAASNTIGTLTITRVRGRLTLDERAAMAAGIDVSPYKKHGEDYWRITERR